MLIPLLVLLVGFPAQTGGNRQALLGADEVMRRLSAQPPHPAEADPFAGPRAASLELSAKLDNLSPKEAAQEWLALMRDWEVAAAKPTPGQSPARLWAEIMMGALPEPATWPLIRAELANQPPSAGRGAVIALFDDLLGRDADVLRDLESMRNPDADPKKEDFFPSESAITKAELPIALRVGDLDLLEKIYVRMAYGGAFSSWNGIPDLVRHFGRARAKRILRQMLEGSTSPFSNIRGVETRELAKSIVLSDLASLKSPHWWIAEGLGDFPRVAAQVARFGERALVDQGSWGGADLIYALGLAKAGQIDDAERVLSSSNPWSGDLGTFVNGGWNERTLFDLVATLLNRKPLDALWPLHSALGRSLGRVDDVVKRLDKWISSPDMPPKSRGICLAQRASLRLERGLLKAAIADYEECVRLDARQYAGTLLRVAEAVGDREALDFVAQAAKSMGTDVNSLDLFAAYLRQGRVQEAQVAVLTAAQDVHNVNLRAEGQGRLLDAYPGTGAQLAELYYEADQPEQIVALLDEYPSWGADDLFDLVDYHGGGYYRSGRRGQSLGFYAAWALGKTGRAPLATRILHSLVDFEPSSDPPFELLNQIEGAEALTLYDRLIKAGPKQSRPLMWKGELLFRIGKLKEAEKCVRAAIALDPTGARAAPGWRRFEYDILARILEAKGDRGSANSCRQVVKAARMTERADQELSAGLDPQAVEHYRQAVNLHPEDGLAQAGLAQAWERVGNHREAVAAYLKALELLPGNQGPAGGMDLPDGRILRNESDRRLAGQTLEKLKRAHPRNRGVLMALGEFRSQVGDHRGALASYEEAVKVDPRDFQAWERIAALAPSGAASKKQIKEAVLALIGLAPRSALNYTSSPGFDAITDKSALWLAYHKAATALPQQPEGPLYPLEASKRSLASGTRPTTHRHAPVRNESPGTYLGSLDELRALFEVGRKGP